MNPNNRIKEPDAEIVIGVMRCPYCNASIYTDETTCRYCGKDIEVRVCPYCKNILPAEQDPCHFCGRLEPAENIAEIEAAQRDAFYRHKFWETFDILLRIIARD